jgi:hypothetical protein
MLSLEESIMSSGVQVANQSKGMLWAGYIIGGLMVLFLTMDGVMKLVKPAFVVEATTKLGYLESSIVGIGIVLLISVAAYIVPRTNVLGAILLTGYLGGAVASHVRAGDGWFEVLFPVVFGALAWIGIYLRDPKVRELAPLRR